jgi:hypothetical protein
MWDRRSGREFRKVVRVVELVGLVERHEDGVRDEYTPAYGVWVNIRNVRTSVERKRKGEGRERDKGVEAASTEAN